MRLVVRELSFSYGRRPALERVSFEAADELLAVIGPNGSGKSTLLKCLCGILRGEGEIQLQIEGKRFDPRKLSRREMAKLIAYLPQDGETGLPLTALEVVLLGRCPHTGFPLRLRGDEIEAAAEALRLVGAEDLATRRFDELSGGERQKVRIARAVAQRPRLMLLDEPLNNLDLKHQIELISLLKRLRAERGMCVIAVLHDLNFASHADKILALKGGKTAGWGRPGEILTPELIEKLFGVKEVSRWLKKALSGSQLL